jgi:hypothetical protein
VLGVAKTGSAKLFAAVFFVNDLGQFVRCRSPAPLLAALDRFSGFTGFGPDSEASDIRGLLSAGLSEALNRHHFPRRCKPRKNQLSPGEACRTLFNKGGGALAQIVGDESAALRDCLTVERVRQG